LILPTKHIRTEQSLLGIGAVLLAALRRPTTVSALWEEVKSDARVGTYERFVLALDLLSAIGAVGFSAGLLRREQR
jgi:hypothetical protein